MDDLISRKAALDALYDWSEHSMTDAEAWHIRQVIGDIKSMPSAQQWIPCSERLPEYGEIVLCYYENDGYGVNRIIDDENDEWLYDGVVAWMPLPEPYQAERRD